MHSTKTYDIALASSFAQHVASALSEAEPARRHPRPTAVPAQSAGRARGFMSERSQQHMNAFFGLELALSPAGLDT